jgi:hypothetical protein
VANIKITVFWDMTTYSLLEMFQRFGVNICLLGKELQILSKPRYLSHIHTAAHSKINQLFIIYLRWMVPCLI